MALAAQGLRRRGKNLPGFCFLAQTNVNFRQPGAHGDILGIHFQSLLENSHRLLELPITQKFFRHLQVLRPRVVEKTLLGIKLGQPQRAFQRRLQLSQLLVHRDGFYREALRGIGIADALEALHSFVGIAET